MIKETTMTLRIILCGLFLTIPGEICRAKEADVASSSPRIVNIINFIRQCEPRIDWITEDVLYETVVEQIRIMKSYQPKGTFLLQYDALMDVRYRNYLRDCL